MAKMPEHDALVQSYIHMSSLPRADEALHTLKRVASMVKPIMRARMWKVRELTEFYPDDQRLLGRSKLSYMTNLDCADYDSNVRAERKSRLQNLSSSTLSWRPQPVYAF